MPNTPSAPPHLMALIKDEIHHLISFNTHTRPWHMPIMAAIASSLPIFLGAYFGQLSYGLIASLGAMVFLNLPYQGSFMFRMVQVLACSMGFVACYGIGMLAHLEARLTLPLLFFIAFWVAVFGRFYRMAPPAGMFILMASAIALFMPVPAMQIPFYVGLIGFGCLFAGVIACIYTLITMAAKHKATKMEPFVYQNDIIINSLIVATTVTLSMAIALSMDMTKPYWAAMSSFVIINGVNFQGIWRKQFQRIIGTFLGMGVAWWLLSLNLNAWGVAVTMFLLAATIETLVVRNYAFAVIFITPMTIIIAEYGSHPLSLVQTVSHSAVILARFWDTVIGCLIGLAGGFVIHHAHFRPRLHAIDQWLIKKLNIIER